MIKNKTPITPLEEWILQRIGEGSEGLCQKRIASYQLLKLRETIRWARERSSFYKERLAGIQEENLARLSDLSLFPFTRAEDIRENPLRFLCVSQSDVKRVVTLQSSGTTGEPKRIYFAEEDQLSTIDFFHHGMSTLVGAGERVLILLPGERPGSVGELLLTGLKRLGATGIPHGPVRDAARTLDVMERERIDALVGIPTQVLSLARHGECARPPRSVLLSTDYVPNAIRSELSRIWGCEVFNHYGMTEMGFGGAVECRAHFGYHLRELDLYFEIVDPETGKPVKEGESGEVVFTTLTRRAMPLIRYRTGDLSRLIPEMCPCGTVLKTMAHVKGRIANRVEPAPGLVLTMADLDEALFPVSGLIDFSAVLEPHEDSSRLVIEVEINEAAPAVCSEVQKILEAHPVISASKRAGALKTVSVGARKCGLPGTSGAGKRTIIDRRGLGTSPDFSKPRVSV